MRTSLGVNSPVVWSRWGRDTGGTGAACRRGCAAPTSWSPVHTGNAEKNNQSIIETQEEEKMFQCETRGVTLFSFTWTVIWNWFRERMYSIRTAMMNLWETPCRTQSSHFISGFIKISFHVLKCYLFQIIVFLSDISFKKLIIWIWNRNYKLFNLNKTFCMED